MERTAANEKAPEPELAEYEAERRKIQNRLYKRASRSRKATAQTTKRNSRALQFQIDRWRVNEHRDSRIEGPRGSNLLHVADCCLDKMQHHPSPMASGDGLLHLIQYNVFRAFDSIKLTLSMLVAHYDTAQHRQYGICREAVFPGFSVVSSRSPNVPGSLAPTDTQKSIIHSTWINLIPFPAMRDRLIKYEACFDHAEFIGDLVGNLINAKLFAPCPPHVGETSADWTGNLHLYDVRKAEAGLIIWGEPHVTENWEVTPAFMKKWSWAVADCHDLMRSTNRWRVSRGEDVLGSDSVTNAC